MSLIYSGNVEIRVGNKRKTLHNHGTSHLFRMFVAMITGSEINQESLPCYFNIYKCTQDKIISASAPFTDTFAANESLLTRKIICHKSFSSQNNEFCAIFDATISSEYRSNISIGSGDPLTLALIAQDERTILAAVDFPYEFYQFLLSGSNAIVKWVMSIKNEETIES